MKVILVALALMSTAPIAVVAQEPPVDSLITHFIERGALAWWGPFALYEGCPNLAPWQRRGVQTLMAAKLSEHRREDLARAWSFALSRCRDAHLEQWFIREMDAAISEGRWRSVRELRRAVYTSATPRMQSYLRRQMADADMNHDIRVVAGGHYFANMSGDEVMREFTSELRARTLPHEVVTAQSNRLALEQPDRLLQEVGRILIEDPSLALEQAFTQIVESSYGRADPHSFGALADDLERGRAQSTRLAPDQRQRIADEIRVLHRWSNRTVRRP